MTPYYKDYERGISIYHGDCRKILPQLKWSYPDESKRLTLTDPPYGIDYDTSHEKYKNGIARRKVEGDAEEYDPAPILALGGKMIVWGGNCFSARLPNSKSWLVWCKTARDDANIRQSDIELAWTNCVGRSRIFHHLWIGAYKASESGEKAMHPNQKPVKLLRWCISLVPGISFVIDPYLGSGTTLVAAKLQGKGGIGIEVDERYCETAARRLEQGVLEYGDENGKEEIDAETIE